LLDLIFVGDVDRQYLLLLTEKAEKLIHKKIRYVLYTPEEWIDTDDHTSKYLLLWEKVAVGS
jgi:hypothetical protein